MSTDAYLDARQFLASADSRIGALIAQRPDYDPHAALSELAHMEPFGVLLFQIIGQQISVAATRAILARFAEAAGGGLPSPSRLLRMTPEAFTAAGVSHRKAATMRAAAQLFLDAGLTRRTLAAMSDGEIETSLTTVPGIGTWTVQGFLVIALDRPDAFPAGDLGIRRAIRDLYGLEALPGEDDAHRRAESWRPYRALAAGYLISWDALRLRGRAIPA